jgi:hypothetical protein
MTVENARLFFGLDLGSLSDSSSLAVVERTKVESEKHYSVRHLQRWSLGTAYPAILDDVATRVANLTACRCSLAIDQTAVGKGVVDIFRPLQKHMDFHPVIITAGRTASTASGVQRLPKIELAATLQGLLQTNRIKFARLPETQTLIKELMDFRVRMPASIDDNLVSWRERPHDDLCFAVMMALWFGERQRDFNIW